MENSNLKTKAKAFGFRWLLKRIAIFAGILIAAYLIVPSFIGANAVGTWKLDSATIDGKKYTTDQLISEGWIENVIEYEFTKDGRLTVSGGGQSAVGTWAGDDSDYYIDYYGLGSEVLSAKNGMLYLKIDTA